VGGLAGLLEGAVLDRIVGPSVVAKTGLVLGVSGVNATGAELGSDVAPFLKKFLVGPNGMSPELPMITATEATIAMAAMITFFVTEIVVFPAAAVAIVLAPLAVEAPVERAAWTAIDWRAESITMLTISVFVRTWCSTEEFIGRFYCNLLQQSHVHPESFLVSAEKPVRPRDDPLEDSLALDLGD
jgi:hypothetical protein